MNKVTGTLYSWPAVITHFLAVPLFFFAFILLYKPLGIENALDMERGLTVFNLTMLVCILLLTLVASRLAMHFLRDHIRLDYYLYTGWCICETIIFSAFGAMYLTLVSKGGSDFFGALLQCLGTFSLILWMPYSILALAFVVKGLRHPGTEAMEESRIIKFHDDRQQMKIALDEQSVLFIEAAENYVQIHYLDNGRIKRYTLRSSMKRIEDLVSSHGMVRCQRAYFINPAHVRLLRRDPEGFIFAEMDTPDAPHIPVSKTYYDKLAAML